MVSPDMSRVYSYTHSVRLVGDMVVQCMEYIIKGACCSTHELMPWCLGSFTNPYSTASLDYCMTPLSLAQGRGKTTLLSVLRNPSSALPENVSTVGVEVAEWVVHPPAVVKKKGGSTSVRVGTCTVPITNCTVFSANPLLMYIKSYPYSLIILLIARNSGFFFFFQICLALT